MNQIHPSLIPGQIVEGSILKLYPNNTAQIRLGTSQILLAQLEASLNIGERYHFEVQKNDQIIHLKVIGEALSQQPKQNAEHLLRDFGLKTTRINVQLIQSLMEEKIPFNRVQLQQGLELIQHAENKAMATEVVKQMLALRLPMNHTVFQALYHQDMHQLTPLMRELVHVMNQETNLTKAQQQAMQVLARMLGITSEESSVGQTSQTVHHHLLAPERQPLMNQQMTMNQSSLKDSIRAIQYMMADSVNQGYIKENIENNILPRLSHEQQQVIRQMLQSPSVRLSDVIITLEQFAHEVQSSSNQLMVPRSASFIMIKEQFIQLIQDYLQFIGTTEEQQLKDGVHPNTSLKTFLLQAMEQESSHVFKQHAQTLLHVLNGIQLQSLHETQFFVQASLQIPGHKFALHDDIFIDFESKKTPDGKIDPDHARVLFYLNLGNLKETIIDMQIQKRHVSLTLFNNKPEIKKHVIALQPLLDKRLEALNYHLTTIHVKPLVQEKHNEKQQSMMPSFYSREGIDFRV